MNEADKALLKAPGEQRAWEEHNLSRLEHFRSLSLREKLGAVQGMADVVRHLQGMRADGNLRLADSISAPLARISTKPAADSAGLISAPTVRKSATDAPTPLSPERVLRFTWTHLADLVRIDNPWKRAFYEIECLNGNWSKRQLQRQMGSLLYERTALSTDKAAVIDRARQQSEETPSRMADLICDPYVFEFVGLAERPGHTESELESALLDHLQQFLLELGAGFVESPTPSPPARRGKGAVQPNSAEVSKDSSHHHRIMMGASNRPDERFFYLSMAVKGSSSGRKLAAASEGLEINASERFDHTACVLQRLDFAYPIG